MTDEERMESFAALPLELGKKMSKEKIIRVWKKITRKPFPHGKIERVYLCEEFYVGDRDGQGGPDCDTEKAS